MYLLYLIYCNMKKLRTELCSKKYGTFLKDKFLYIFTVFEVKNKKKQFFKKIQIDKDFKSLKLLNQLKYIENVKFEEYKKPD
tara:strand:- start:1272 stop:1517 length:246 start_codon:yes stop_codon:yes gene_type:complete